MNISQNNSQTTNIRSQNRSPRLDNSGHFDEATDHLVNRYRGNTKKYFELDRVLHNDHFRMSDIGIISKQSNSFVKVSGERRLTHSRGSTIDNKEKISLARMSRTNIEAIEEEEQILSDQPLSH